MNVCMHFSIYLSIYLRIGTYNDICINIFIPKEGDSRGVGISVTDLTLTLCCDWDNAYLPTSAAAGGCLLCTASECLARAGGYFKRDIGPRG